MRKCSPPKSLWHRIRRCRNSVQCSPQCLLYRFMHHFVPHPWEQFSTESAEFCRLAIHHYIASSSDVSRDDASFDKRDRLAWFMGVSIRFDFRAQIALLDFLRVSQLSSSTFVLLMYRRLSSITEVHSSICNTLYRREEQRLVLVDKDPFTASLYPFFDTLSRQGLNTVKLIPRCDTCVYLAIVYATWSAIKMLE